MSKVHKGKKISQKHREILSKKKSGKNNPMYGRKGKNHPFYGKHHSEETKKKISQANSGKNNPMYGKKMSEETKMKIRKNKPDTSGENNPMYGTGDSGISYVFKAKSNRYTQGYRWVFQKTINGKQYSKSSVNLRKLEKNVLKDNQEWIILNKEKAKQSYQESDKNNKR